MAAGTYTNSLTALNGIYGALAEVLKILDSKEKESKNDKTKDQVKSLNKGGLTSDVTSVSSSEIKNIPQQTSLKEVSSALLTLPPSIKAVAALAGKTMNAFNSVLTSLGEVLNEFGEDENSVKGAKALTDTATALAKLQEIKFFSLLLSFSIADKLNLGKKIGKVLSQLSDAMGTAEKMKLDKDTVDKFKNLNSSLSVLSDSVKRVSLVSPLIPIFDLAMLLLKPGMSIYVSILKKLEDAKISKSAKESIQLLNDLTKGLTGIILSTVVLAASFKIIGIKETLLGLAASLAIMTALTGLSIAVLLVSNKLKGADRNFSEINKFIRNIVLCTGAILALSIAASVMKQSIWDGLAVVGAIMLGLTALSIIVGISGRLMRVADRGLTEISKFMIAITLMTGAVLVLSTFATTHKDVIIPGLGIIAGIILGLTLISVLAGAAAAVIQPRAFKDVMLVAGFSLALVLGTLLIGALMSLPGTWEMLAYGLGAVVAMLTAMTLIAFTAGILGTFVEGAGPALKQVVFFSGFLLAFVLGTILVGEVVKLGWDAALIGLAAITAAVTTLGGLLWGMTALSKQIKAAEQTGVIKDILIFAGSILLITLGIVAIGALIKNVGFGYTSLAFVAFSAVLWEMVGVAATIIKIDKSNVLRDSQKGLIEISIFAGAVLAVTAGLVGIAKLIEQTKASAILGAFGLFTAVLGETVLLAKFASKARPELEKGAKDLLLAMAIVGASEVILGGIIGLAVLLKDLVQDDWTNLGYIGGVFLAMNGIIYAAEKLAKNASRKKKIITEGATSLLLAEGVILSSAIVLGAIILVAKKLQDFGSGNIIGASVAIAATFIAMIGIVQSAAHLSKVASKQQKNLLKGAVALLAAEGIALGSAIILMATLKVTQEAKALGDWGQVFITLGAMATIVAGFGAIAIAAGLISTGPQAALFFAGIAALGLAEIIAWGSTKVLAATIEVAKKEQDLGPGGWGQVFTTLGAMATIVAGFGAIGTAIGLAAPFILIGLGSMAAIRRMSSMSLDILKSVIDYVKESENLQISIDEVKGKLLMVVDIANAYRSVAIKMPIIGVAKGLVAARGINALSSVLNDILKTYNELQSYNIEFNKDKNNITTVGDIINSYKSLAESASKRVKDIKKGLTSISLINESMKSTFTLIDTYISLAEKMSKINVTPERLQADMKGMMSVMDPSILLKAFTDSDGNILSDSSKIMKDIKKGAKAYDKMVAVVSKTMEMFANFLKNTKGIDLNTIDFVGIASSISGAVGAFMTTLDGGIEDLSKKRAKELKRVGEVLGSIISPISNFAEVLMKYVSSGDDTLKQVWYNDEGLPVEGKAINVKDSAAILVRAITSFCDVLYNKDNMEIWKNLAAGSTDKTQSDLQKGIGIFASVVDPVVKFAEILGKFEAEGTDTLIIPEYDDKGNLKPSSRKINVKNVASVLANAVTTFINELYVNNRQTWIDLVNSLNMIPTESEETAEAMTGAKAPLSDAIGVFADILNPIMNFAGVLEKFGIAKSGNLAIVDKNGKLKEVNVSEVSSKISIAVTEFISKLGSIFTNPETLASIASINENSGNIINAINSFGNSFSNISGLDLKNLKTNTDELTSGITSVSNTVLATTQLLSDDVITKFNNIIQSSVEIASMNTSLTGFKDTILSLADETVPSGIAEFNDKFNTLVNHIESASQDSNVKKLDKFSKSVKMSTTELRSFDKTLSDGTKKRNKDLKDFSDALKPITSSLKDAREDIKNLRDLFTSINNTDVSKASEVMTSISEKLKFGRGGGGASPTQIEEAVGNALIYALSAVFEGASLYGKVGKVGTADKKDIELNLDINNAVSIPSSSSYAQDLDTDRTHKNKL